MMNHCFTLYNPSSRSQLKMADKRLFSGRLNFKSRNLALIRSDFDQKQKNCVNNRHNEQIL